MKSIIPTRVAVILFALVFAVFGINHFMFAEMMAGIVPIPGGVIWVYVTGACFLLAAIAFIVNKQARLAGYLLALLLLIIVLTIHLPAFMKGDQMAMSSLLKDVGLMAGAIIVGNMSTN